jgi:ferrous iron transport protein A
MELTHTQRDLPISIGSNYKLLDYGNIELSFRRQLYTQGLLPGTILKLIRIAPLGCPMEFRLNNLSLVLRRSEWLQLVWEVA